MKVTFYNDYSVIIDEKMKLRLGDILLEFIGNDFSDFYILCDNLIKELEYIAPWKQENTALGKYLELVNTANILEKRFAKALQSLPFYRLSTPKHIFVSNILISDTKDCIRWCDKDTLLADAEFPINEDLHEIALRSVKSYKETIASCSRLFRELVDTCLLGEDISPINKLIDYGLDKIGIRMSEIESSYSSHFSLEHKIIMVNGIPVLNEVYTITTPTQYLYHDFINLIKNGLRIKKCANCGMYFVLFSGHSIEYCDNIPEGETKPCSVIGSARLYAKKLKDDPILENYTRSYKTHYSRIKAGYLTEEQFKIWSKEAKLMRSRAYTGEITLDEFITWCKK
jgi:hypothetical protein